MDQKILADRPGLDLTGLNGVPDGLWRDIALLGNLGDSTPFL
jgi:hypothetical protein